jgi:hypothetical protein
MSTPRAGKRRVVKCRLYLDERGSRRPAQSIVTIHRWRLRESEDDTVLKRVTGASRQDQKK